MFLLGSLSEELVVNEPICLGLITLRQIANFGHHISHSPSEHFPLLRAFICMSLVQVVIRAEGRKENDLALCLFPGITLDEAVDKQ